LVVLDPPRTGAGVGVIEQVIKRRPRAIAYVACDGATYARDLKAALAAGWRLDQLRAFDLFPSTAHVELVSLLLPPVDSE
jgi:tRNA/tmRNA/rRNA uracil-C5-methylase (TrmA/RlmC/RlmD family)